MGSRPRALRSRQHRPKCVPLGTYTNQPHGVEHPPPHRQGTRTTHTHARAHTQHVQPAPAPRAPQRLLQRGRAHAQARRVHQRVHQQPLSAAHALIQEQHHARCTGVGHGEGRHAAQRHLWCVRAARGGGRWAVVGRHAAQRHLRRCQPLLLLPLRLLLPPPTAPAAPLPAAPPAQTSGLPCRPLAALIALRARCERQRMTRGRRQRTREPSRVRVRMREHSRRLRRVSGRA